MIKQILNSRSFWISSVISGFIIFCFFMQQKYPNHLVSYGIYPRTFQGLKGVFLSPLLHGSVEHLISNITSLFILLIALVKFYPELYKKVLTYVWLIGGFWTWIYARDSYHVGASGLVYGISFFLLVSGFIRKEKKVMAISFLIIILNGGFIWGVFPDWALSEWFDFTPSAEVRNISWEGHLSGAVIGIVLAFYYRKIGVQAKEFNWNDEYYDNLPPEKRYWEKDYPERMKKLKEEKEKLTEEAKINNTLNVRYLYRKKKPSNKSNKNGNQ